MMKQFHYFLLVICLLLLTGCATKNYLVVLNNNTGIISVGKPHLEGFNFVFTGVDGKTNSIESEHVRAVVPYKPKPPSK